VVHNLRFSMIIPDIKYERLLFIYLFINIFAFFAFLLDFGITFAVAKYGPIHFLLRERNSYFISVVNGSLENWLIIIGLNLIFILPFTLYGYWFLKSNEKQNKWAFLTFVHLGTLSFVLSFAHVIEGLKWL